MLVLYPCVRYGLIWLMLECYCFDENYQKWKGETKVFNLEKKKEKGKNEMGVHQGKYLNLLAERNTIVFFNVFS